MSALWRASWCETRPTPGMAPAAGSWTPFPWATARHVLADQLRANMPRWARDARTRREYAAVLSLLEHAAEPRNGSLCFDLRDHSLALIRSEAPRD